MKYLVQLCTFVLAFSCSNSFAQLYLNGDVTIQSGATIFADDTVQLGSSAIVNNNGTIESSKSINTNGYFIITGTSGFIISPVSSGAAKSFDIGTTSNNKIQIQHSTGIPVVFQLAVRDNVYINPQTSTSQITSNVVNKTWYLAAQSSVSNLVGTAYWNASDELSGFNRSNCGVSYWQSGTSTAWSFTNGTSAATNTGSSPAYSKIASTAGLTAGVYYFGVGGSGSALPVTLISFDAIKIENDDVLLNWITASEINNQYFEIERSVNDQLTEKQFEPIAKIKGAGNSNCQLKYNYIDETPFAKINVTKIFYRLKQVDFDGNFQYTEIKEVDLEKNITANMQISVYPNPNTEILNVDIESLDQKNILLTVFDAGGREIVKSKYELKLGKQTLQINTSSLARGVYMLNISDETKSSISQHKLVIY